jgi:hypothetical protein
LLDFEFANSYRNTFKSLNQGPYLKDPANPLDESEILAIWFYTADFFWQLRQDIMNGTAGLWNCYFDFYDNATSKLAVAPSTTVLFSGISRNNSVAWGLTDQAGDLLFGIGDIIVATSPGSSTDDFNVAYEFMNIAGATPLHGLLFEITDPRTPVDIAKFSKYPREREFMFSPGARLEVVDIENLNCSVLNCDTQTNPMILTVATLTELEPAKVVWKDGAQEGLTQTPSPSPALAKAEFWASTGRSKAFFGVMIAALLLFGVFGMWTLLLTEWCRRPCGADSRWVAA